MFDWIWGHRIAENIEEGNEIAEKNVQLSAREKAVALKLRKEELSDKSCKAWEEASNKVREANRLADRTYVMRILAEAPHSAKVKVYYKKVWDEISTKHTALIKEWEELKLVAKKAEEESKEAHKEWHKFKTHYNLWGDDYC